MSFSRKSGNQCSAVPGLLLAFLVVLCGAPRVSAFYGLNHVAATPCVDKNFICPAVRDRCVRRLVGEQCPRTCGQCTSAGAVSTAPLFNWKISLFTPEDAEWIVMNRSVNFMASDNATYEVPCWACAAQKAVVEFVSAPEPVPRRLLGSSSGSRASSDDSGSDDSSDRDKDDSSDRDKDDSSDRDKDDSSDRGKDDSSDRDKDDSSDRDKDDSSDRDDGDYARSESDDASDGADDDDGDPRANCRGRGERLCYRPWEEKSCPRVCEKRCGGVRRMSNRNMWSAIKGLEYDQVFIRSDRVCVARCKRGRRGCGKRTSYRGRRYCLAIRCDDNQVEGCHSGTDFDKPTCEACAILFPRSCRKRRGGSDDDDDDDDDSSSS